MNNKTTIQLVTILLALLVMSYLSYNAANTRQVEITRSVVLIDTQLINKEYNGLAYTDTKGVFYEPSMQKKFTAPIDDPLYVSFMSGGKKPLELRRAFSLDTIDGTFAGPMYRGMSVIILGYLVFMLVQLVSLQDRLVSIPKKS